MRISDWSSDVCSSDLLPQPAVSNNAEPRNMERSMTSPPRNPGGRITSAAYQSVSDARRKISTGKLSLSRARHPWASDRQSVVSGKSGSIRVDLGGRRILKKKKPKSNKYISHKN